MATFLACKPLSPGATKRSGSTAYFFATLCNIFCGSNKVTARAMTPIKINRVANQQPMHPAPQICPVVLCHQRKMVAHQNKTQNRRLKPLRRLTDQFEEARPLYYCGKSAE